MDRALTGIAEVGQVLLRALGSNTSFGWAVVLVIVLVAVRTAVALVAIRQSVGRQATELHRVVEEVTALGPGGFPQGSSALSTLIESTTGIARSLLVLLEGVRKLPAPELSLVISVATQRESEPLQRFRPVPNALMMLGLFGTVVGLAAVVGSLGPQIEVAIQLSDTGGIKNSLGESLRAMQTAFACTIFGVLSALVVSSLLNRVATMQSVLASDAEAITVQFLAPAILPSSPEFQLEMIQQALTDNKAFQGTFRTALESVATAVSSAMVAAGESARIVTESLADAAQSFTEQLSLTNEATRQTVESLRVAATAARDGASELRAVVSGVPTSLGELQTAVQRELAVGTDSQRSMSHEISRSLQEIQALIERQGDSLSRSVSEFPATQAHALDRLADLLDPSLNAVLNVDRHVGGLGPTLEGIRASLSDLHESIARGNELLRKTYVEPGQLKGDRSEAARPSVDLQQDAGFEPASSQTHVGEVGRASRTNLGSNRLDSDPEA
jgi:hypothetical protein